MEDNKVFGHSNSEDKPGLKIDDPNGKLEQSTTEVGRKVTNFLG